MRDEWISSVKTATRCTVRMIGTLDEAAAVAGVSRSPLGRCASATDPDIISISAAMRLMAETGAPDILVAMAGALGFSVVAADGAKPPSCIASAFGSVADEFGDVASRVGEAMRDGQITPNEQRGIAEAMSRLGRAVTNAQGTPMVVVAGNGKAS